MVGDSADELEQELRLCAAEVESSIDHQLSFLRRRRMLACIGPVSLPLAALDGEVATPHTIRASIAARLLARAARIWTSHFEGDPGDLQLILDLIDDPQLPSKRRRLFREGMKLKNHLDGGAPPGVDGYQYVWAGYTVAMGAMVIAQDEYLSVERQGGTVIDLEEPETHHSFDPAAFGAATHAGDFPWGREEWFSADRNLEYWRWYLDVVREEALSSDAEGTEP